MTEVAWRYRSGCFYRIEDVSVTRRAIGMRSRAIGWINTHFLSIDLLCDPALPGTVVPNVLTHTANFKYWNIRGHQATR